MNSSDYEETENSDSEPTIKRLKKKKVPITKQKPAKQTG